MLETLVTFAGGDDPFAPSLIHGDEQPGPVLSLLRAHDFARVVLLDLACLKAHTDATQEAVREEFPKLALSSHRLDLPEPFHLDNLVRALRDWIAQRREENAGETIRILTKAGSPLTRAAWLLLAEEQPDVAPLLLDAKPHRFLSLTPLRARMVPLVPSSLPVGAAEALAVEEEPLPFQVEEDPFDHIDAVAEELGCIGEHPRFRSALQLAGTLAEHDTPILIQGETGTGKDVFARLVHRLSRRKARPLVTVNCAALPEPLAESLLFGHRKGAFTGAAHRQIGKFEVADGGILFLDELAELSLKVQAKLLRIIEDGLVEPLGATNPVKVNVRVIAATNRDLQQEVVRGTFREDLYYRLRVGEIWLPPLRERRTDIPKIALHLLDRINQDLKQPKRLSRESLDYLQKQSWPGNVRDLQNVIERSAMLAKKRVIEPPDLSQHPVIDVRYQGESALPDLREGFSLERYLSDIRRRLIEKSLDIADGNQSEAARLLGVTPQAVHKYVKTKALQSRAHD